MISEIRQLSSFATARSPKGVDALLGICYLTLGVNGDCLWRVEVFAGGFHEINRPDVGTYTDSATTCDGFGDAGLTNVSVSA